MTDSIKHLLDIFLITYNRSYKLERTLSQIFSENSPIKDFEIKIIDNNSTDNTYEIIKKYQEKFSNLKYTKNKLNIGGNANIARTFELAQKEYLWILCDDDNYCWDAWEEVVQAIKSADDCILVSNCDCPKLGLAQCYAQTSFLPGAIYKMSNFDENVLSNMHYNISNMFPHMAFSSKLINEGKKFKTISKSIVVYGGSESELSVEYTRGCDRKNIHPYSAELSYSAGYANTLMLIQDKKLRHYLAEKRRFYVPSMTSADFLFYNSKKNNGSLYNIFCVFNVLSFWQKLKFMINHILFYTLYRFFYVYLIERYDEKNDIIYKILKIRLFFLINTNILKIKIKHKGSNK